MTKQLTGPQERRIHNRCGRLVIYTTLSDGYSAVCPSCDEDLYLFETGLEESND
jgi:hypothetical protein